MRMRGNNDFDEVLSIAQEGLIHAAARFDPSSGFTFATYAYPCIRGYILQSMCPSGKNLQRWRERCVRFHGKYDRDEKGLMIEPTDHRAEPAWEKPFQEELWQRIRKWLDPRRYQVLFGRFVEGKNLKDVGVEMGLTRERVRQLEATGLDRLRRRVPNLEEILLDAVNEN